jgi:hypothetical protein
MEPTATDGFRDRPIWLLAVAALVLAQVGLVLALFGPARSWAAITDDRPILSGRHPLHQYHGTLGATSFRLNGTTTCYDPNFQAGYPKTPVFDGGSRPAELFMLIGGGAYRPAAYKLGLFTFLCLIPVAFVMAARGAGLPCSAAILSGAGGILLGWSAPARLMIVEGELDLLTAWLAAVVFVPWLARFARSLGADAWAILAGAAVVGWYFHPLVWVGLAPVIFTYYLVFAPRHGPAWHLGLAGITFAGVVPNAWWLIDWGKYWWLRQPMASEHIPLPAWHAVIGNFGDYQHLFGSLPGGLFLLLGGTIGLVMLWRGGHSVAAWLLMFASALTIAAARVAGAWSAVPPDVPGRIVVLAAGFLVPPMAHLVWRVLHGLHFAAPGTILVVLGLTIVGWLDGPGNPLARAAGVTAKPLALGFRAEEQALISVLKEQTTAEARILWDESSDRHEGWNWTALLPLITNRSFLGGLDPEAGVEHSYCAMCSRQLMGRALHEWLDADLMEFCKWYNIGWVVARSPSSIDRWSKCPQARVIARLQENGKPLVVFALDRPRSFILSGTANWEMADTRRITLTNVVPSAAGDVQLSLHHVEGLRVFPSYIHVEALKDMTGRDPVDHVRLCMPGPVPRVTLTWKSP